MPVFHYKATDHEACTRTGRIEAAGRQAALDTLNALGIVVEEMHQIDVGESAAITEAEGLAAGAPAEIAENQDEHRSEPSDALSQIVEEMLDGLFIAPTEEVPAEAITIRRREAPPAEVAPAHNEPAVEPLSAAVEKSEGDALDLPDQNWDVLFDEPELKRVLNHAEAGKQDGAEPGKEEERRSERSAAPKIRMPSLGKPAKPLGKRAGKVPGLRPGRALPSTREMRKTPADGGSEWEAIVNRDEKREKMPALVRLSILASVLILLSSVGSFVWYAFFYEKPPPPPEKIVYHPLEITVKGRVRLANLEPPGEEYRIPGLDIVFHFPEIPVDFEKSGEDVLIDAKGHFEATFKMNVRNVPTYLFLTVKKEGYMVRHVNKAPILRYRECTIQEDITLMPYAPYDKKPRKESPPN